MSYYRRPWALYAAVTLVYLFLFLPIVDVVVNSFNGDSTMVSWGGFTTRWYSVAWSDPTVLQAAKTTVIIAIVVTALSAVLGTATALALVRARRASRAAILGTTYARLVVPELIIGLALLVVLVRLGVRLNMWTIVLGHTVFDSAFVTIIVSARLAARDRSLDEAARDLYATPFRAFRRVTLPDILPGIVAGSLLAFTFSLDDVVTSFFLSGSTTTLPLVILGLVRVTITPEVNAIGVVLMMATLATMLAFIGVNWRWSARRGSGAGLAQSVGM